MHINKLYISLIFSILGVLKLLIFTQRMHNLYAILAKFIDICKQFSTNLVNTQDNIPRGRGPLFRFGSSLIEPNYGSYWH